MAIVGERIYFSEWLQNEMNKRGWSQSDLARAADLNRAVINKLLNGKSHPQPATLEAISRALKIPIETTYRAAGLLPVNSDNDETVDEAIYVLKSIHSAQRKATAVALLKALIAEEENEMREERAKR
ncbi:MAG: helix-turn-helix domain-containing protein [Bacteroidota bacterium]|jgi:transcriptional regulator with XRE-family HTH domain